MSDFDSILETIKGENPELADQLSTAYISDMETRDAKIGSLESGIAERDAKINVYARENYDLMRAQPPGDPAPEPVKARDVGLDDIARHWSKKR